MNKKIIQDVIIKEIDGGGEERLGRGGAEAAANHSSAHHPHHPLHPHHKTGKSALKWVATTLVGVAVVLGIFFFATFQLSKVTLKVTLQEENVTMEDLLFINKTNKVDGGAKFDLMKVEDSSSVSIAPTGTKKANIYAKGKVTIYNTYSGSPRKLVTNTRVETKDGLIYKLAAPVTIPGYTVESAGSYKMIPGSVEADVVAAAPGEKYNRSSGDLTIPGLKGSPQYETVYAKIISPISGGFSGDAKSVSSKDIADARQKLKAELSDRLMKRAITQVPESSILFNDATFVTYTDNAVGDDSLSQTDGGDGTNFKMNATLSAFLVDKEDLKSFVLGKRISPTLETDVATIPGLPEISLKVMNKDKIDPATAQNVLVKLSGDIRVIGGFDEGALKTKLSGLSKKEYQTVFKDFPAIEKAEAIFTPSWAMFFPKDLDKITIEELNK